MGLFSKKNEGKHPAPEPLLVISDGDLADAKRIMDHWDASVQGTWVISPHPDDAALSLAVAIREGVLPRPVHVLTVFSISGFSRIPDLDTAATTSTRAAEDAAFAEAFGVELSPLGLPDAPLRTGLQSRHFLDPSVAIDDAEVQVLATRIAGAARDLDTAVLVLPAGIGSHIDHRIALQVAKHLNPARLLVYADQPYAICEGISEAVARFGSPAWIAPRLKRHIESKAEAVAYYPSQPAAERLLAAITDSTNTAPLELLWCLS